MFLSSVLRSLLPVSNLSALYFTAPLHLFVPLCYSNIFICIKNTNHFNRLTIKQVDYDDVLSKDLKNKCYLSDTHVCEVRTDEPRIKVKGPELKQKAVY